MTPVRPTVLVDDRPWVLVARSPRGRAVRVVAVRRGLTLRDYVCGDGSGAGLAMEAVLDVFTFVLSRVLTGWTVGVITVDRDLWWGERVLHRERCPRSGDPRSRVQQLHDEIVSGAREVGESSAMRRRVPTVDRNSW